MSKFWILLATFAAYLPSAGLPVLAHRSDVPGGPLDPSALVVPFCLAFAAAFPFWGRAADRLTPVRVIAVALGLTGLAGGAVALAPTEATLVLARVLQGAAAAGVPPAAQAAIAAASAERQAGRALSPMMLAVAFAVLGGPAVASPVADAVGWTAAAVAIGAAMPLALAGAGLLVRGAPRADRRASVVPYRDVRGVRAGWIVSACVLAGHWTVLTRIAEALGPSGLGAGDRWVAAAPLTGAFGLPLVFLAARACDRVGPCAPMAATLVVGALGFALATTAASAGLFIAAAGVGFAVYWAYLPVVAAQVQRSAGTDARGRAAGGLYASMWCGAALAGALASLAQSWQAVLAGAAVSWGVGAIVAWRRFICVPAVERSDVATTPRPA
jgi:MFS transporter, YNFM family, putative membrane transport protein